MTPINSLRDRSPRALPDAPVLPLWRASRVDVLDGNELGRLREAIDRRLSDDGVVVPSAYARARLGSTAAVVDDERRRVRLPGPVVAAALEGASAPFVLAGRDAVRASRMLKRSFVGGMLSAGINVRGPTSRTRFSIFPSSRIFDRATRECAMSPQIATDRRCSRPLARLIVSASSSA